MPKNPSTKQSEKPSITNSPKSWREYQLEDGDLWVTEDFDRLAQTFPGLNPENLPALHALAVSRKDFETPWAMLRRLCGIRPAIVPMDVDANKLRPMPRNMVAEIFQTAPEEVDLSLSILVVAWNQITAAEDTPEYNPPAEQSKAKSAAARSEGGSARSGKVEVTLEQLDLLDLCGLSTNIFDYPLHTDHDRYVEIEWFCDMVKDIRRVFEEPMAKALARNALLNQLHIRRIEVRLAALDPAQKEFISLQDTKREMERTYGEQWEQIEQLCPLAAASVTRKSMINSFGDIVKVYQAYKADPDNRLRDGIHTDEEIQVLFRSSIQVPDIHYRYGQVVAMNEAKLGLGDPHWKRKMDQDLCKILDSAVQYAARKAADKLKVKQPDLESLGADGEYPPLYQKPDGEMSELTLEEIVESVGEPAVEIAEAKPVEVKAE
jgi:hypothetical protein